MVSKSALQTIDRVIRQGSIAFDTSIHHRCLHRSPKQAMLTCSTVPVLMASSRLDSYQREAFFQSQTVQRPCGSASLCN